MAKQQKSAAEIEQLMLDAVRKYYGCSEVVSVKVRPHSKAGWTAVYEPGRADTRKVRRAVIVEQIALRNKYELAVD